MQRAKKSRSIGGFQNLKIKKTKFVTCVYYAKYNWNKIEALKQFFAIDGRAE